MHRLSIQCRKRASQGFEAFDRRIGFFSLLFQSCPAILGDTDDNVISKVLACLPECGDLAAPIVHIDP
jgi:hypothetical protein